MTTLTPLISSTYKSQHAAAASNHSFIPVLNSERTLYATATFDVMSPPLIGQSGATFINDVTVRSNARGWFALQIIEPTIFDNLISNWDAPPSNTFVFAKDHVLYGNFTTIKLISGAIIAYKL